MSAVWIRTADLRHALSTLFSTSFYTDEINSESGDPGSGFQNKNTNNEIQSVNDRWIENTQNSTSFSTSFSTSLEGKQCLAAKWGGFGLKEVLAIARSNLDHNTNASHTLTANNSNNSDSIGAGGSGSGSYNDIGSGSSTYRTNSNSNISMREWSAMVTSSFLEEKISLSFSVGTIREASEWLTQWVHISCEVRT